ICAVGERGAEEDSAVLAGVAGVPGIDAIAPQLEAGFEDMLPARHGYGITELDDSVGEVLLYNRVSDVGNLCAAIWPDRINPADTRNVRQAPCPFALDRPSSVTGLPMLELKADPLNSAIDLVPKRTSFKRVGPKVWV